MSKSWPNVPLGEVLTERRELPTDSALANGEIRIVAKIGFNDGKIYLRADSQTKTGMILIRPGDLVVSGINAVKGAVAVYGEENADPIAATIHYGSYIPNQTRVEVSYLWWLLRSRTFRELLAEHLPGGIKTELKAKRLLPIPIPLPALEEQGRIVVRVEELAAKIGEARDLRKLAIEEAEVLVNATARSFLAGVRAQTSELRHWLNRDREGIQTGPFGAQLVSHDFVDAGVPVLTIGNIQYGGLELRDLKYVSEEKARQLKRYAVREGDILFARMGTVGRCCVVPEIAEGWLVNYHIIRVALDLSLVEPRYVHWSLQASAEIKKFLDEKIRGATRQGVNSSIVGALPCRVPPLAEQCRIVDYLDSLQAKADSLKRFHASTAAELDALLPSIIDKAFRGEL